MATWRCFATWPLNLRKISTNGVKQFLTNYSSNSNDILMSFSTVKHQRAQLGSAEDLKNFKTVEEFTLATPEFHATLTEEVHLLQDVFKKYGYCIRLAGGPVRDLLLGIKPKDLDFATTATPDEMKEMFTKESIRMINTAGEKHGTITARINEDNFEITTLRIDEITDGRHAEVKFIKNWELDANRRDFTINSMFLDLIGTVYDYCNGLEDLNKRRIKFVGHPAHRITEDYLRIMRYFRFVGRISKDPHQHDEMTISTIKDLKSGLNGLSGERVWSELQKTVEGNFGPDLLHFMLETGLGSHMGFPLDLDLNAFADFRERLNTLNEPLKAITVICALLQTPDEILTLRRRLKFSNFDRDCGLFVLQHRDTDLSKNPLRHCRSLVITTQGKPTDVRQYVEQVLLYKGLSDVLKEFREWTIPDFPVKGNLISSVVTITNVKHIGILISMLKCYWAENDFKPTEEELLVKLPHLYEKFNLTTQENKRQ